MSFDTRLVGFRIATQRGIDFAIALYLLPLFFLGRYPVRLNRNILAHSALYAVFFFGGALTLFIRTMLGALPPRPLTSFLKFFPLHDYSPE